MARRIRTNLSYKLFEYRSKQGVTRRLTYFFSIIVVSCPVV